MERAAVTATPPTASAFRDGLGERRHVSDPNGKDTIELLCLRAELAAVPSFEFALRERVSRLTAFRHPQFGRVRSVERLPDADSTLAIASERVGGVRLSDLLMSNEQRRLGLDITASLHLMRQLVPAIVAFHESVREIAHGTIGPERLIVTPDGQLVVVEYVMGAALEQLRYTRERYWSELRVAMPSSAGLPRFDQRGDVTQIGVVALSLILGRAMRLDEYPMRIADVVASTWAVSPRGGLEPLPQGLRTWLGRALQLDARTGFTTAQEARAELDKVVAEGDYLASAENVSAFLARYRGEPIAAASLAQAPSAPAPQYAPMPTRPNPAPPPPVAPIPSLQSSPAYAAAAQHTPPRGTPLPSQMTPPRGTSTPAQAVSDLQITSLADSVITRTPPRGMPRTSSSPATTQSIPRSAITPPSAPASKPVVSTIDEHEEATPIWRRPAIMGALAVLVAAGAFAGLSYVFSGSSSTSAKTGTLVITTNPTGAQATVDGVDRGVTPLRIDLSAGVHKLELKSAGGTRTVPVTIAEGTQVSQYIELPLPQSGVGHLSVRTEPPGARITVDGVAHGTSPTTVADLTTGEHAVVLESDLGSVKQTVMIESGATAQLVVPMTAPNGAPVSAWIAVTSPIEVQVLENNKLLGSSRSDRIMIAAGHHQVDLVNEPLGFHVSRTFDVAAGKVAPVSVDIPNGTIGLNAAPWAEVWIDGAKVGETPIGNLPISIGTHEVVFRHPELGERRLTVTVTLKEVARFSADFSKP
jgi:PEGA domain-containing protein